MLMGIGRDVGTGIRRRNIAEQEQRAAEAKEERYQEETAYKREEEVGTRLLKKLGMDLYEAKAKYNDDNHPKVVRAKHLFNTLSPIIESANKLQKGRMATYGDDIIEKTKNTETEKVPRALFDMVEVPPYPEDPSTFETIKDYVGMDVSEAKAKRAKDQKDWEVTVRKNYTEAFRGYYPDDDEPGETNFIDQIMADKKKERDDPDNYKAPKNYIRNWISAKVPSKDGRVLVKQRIHRGKTGKKTKPYKPTEAKIEEWMGRNPGATRQQVIEGLMKEYKKTKQSGASGSYQ